MTPPALMPFLLRLTLVLVAVVGTALPGAHAAGRNHDVQTIEIPTTFPAFHDHAPGPTVR